MIILNRPAWDDNSFLSPSENKTRRLLQCLSVPAILILMVMCLLGSTFPLQAETLITNRATASYSINGVLQSKSHSVSFSKDTVVPPPDVINLQKQVNTRSANIDDLVSYTLTIQNPNNHPLTHVMLEDTLPVGLKYENASMRLNGSQVNTNRISFTRNQMILDLGELPAHTSWSIKYNLKVTSLTPAGAAINLANVHSDTASSATAQASVNIQAAPPTQALTINKHASKSSAKIGETIRYTLTISNTNRYEIQNIRLEDTLPSGLEFIKGSTLFNGNTFSGATTLAGNQLEFKLGNIPAGSKWQLSYDTLIKNTIIARTLTNQARVVSNDPDANSAVASAAIEIISDTIILSKQADKQNVKPGETVNYTVIVQNPTLHELQNLTAQDMLPEGFSYKPASATLDGQPIPASAIQINGRSLQLALGSLARGKSKTIHYQADVTAETPSGIAINQIQASSDYAISNLATAEIVVRTPSTINFLKIDDQGEAAVIPPTAYNDNQNGGKHWQEIDTISLPDGSTLRLPTPQPLVDAKQYSEAEPVIIQVRDLDQNTDPVTRQTIIVTIEIPGTHDKEILLLTETAADSGIFRGVILTTTAKSKVQNGLLTLKNGVKINVSYRDQQDNTDVSASVALVIPDTQLTLTKSSDKSVASIGELVRFTLVLKNASRYDLPVIQVRDTLPVGFRYLSGSATLNGAGLRNHDTVSANGRLLEFKLASMPAGSQWQIEYVTKLAAGVPTGKVTNVARVRAGTLSSNIARASVKIEDELMRTRNILTGRVFIGCENPRNQDGQVLPPRVLENARIYMETGRSVLTDEEGFWHMEGVQPGAHVLQLDTDSLADTYKPVRCKDNTRYAGDAKSRFVDLQPGSLWQVDFHVEKLTKPLKSTIAAYPHHQDLIQHKTINPLEKFGVDYLNSAQPGFDILWPANNYVPDVASTKIMVKSSPQQIVEVYLNGKQVNPLNYDGSDSNKKHTVTISRWRGVDLDINKRNNDLLVLLKNKAGKEIARMKRNIHFSGEPATAEFLADQSRLVADGKTTPVIVLRIKDEDGFPMRANTHGYFTLDSQDYQVKTLVENQDVLNLNESLAGSYKYLIGEGGIARIQLNPTTQSGELKLNFTFKDKTTQTIRTWLKPHLRQWILVGIAEGTLAYNTLSGNLQSLKDLHKDDKFVKRGRVAFFAKGKIKGKYLLTLAYDTHKQKSETGSQLDGNINPDAWYTVYADNSSSQYDAPSSRKLYVKIEKDDFYALFGDYHTGLTVTELANYERVLNGIKSEYKGKRYNYNAFISETGNQHQHLEIPGDGTSGLYRLTRHIVPNSETVRIETRDRFHSENILERRELTRYQDYDIDYDAGTLFFKFPVTGRDRDFNPNIIVVDYDSEDDSNKQIIGGGRLAMTSPNKRIEVGVSAIREGRNKARDNTLLASDLNYKVTPDTTLHAEIAQSKTAEGKHKSKKAYIVELEKQISDMEARLYYRKQDENFGLASQASESGTQKAGAELRYRPNDKTNIDAEISHQQNLANDNQRQLAQVNIKRRYDQYELRAGARHSKEQLGDESITNNTLLGGAQYTSNNGKITLRSDIEKNIGPENGSGRSPDRAVLGVDIKLKHDFTLFAEHETTDNGKITTHNNRVGVSKPLWKGAKARTSYTMERTDQRQRNYATLGLSQRIKLNDKINADLSIDQARTIGSSQSSKRFNENEPPIQGPQRDDYTAFSVGLGSNDKDWSWTTRFELRNGDVDDKINFRAGLIRHLDDGKNLSAKISYYNNENESGDFENITRLSLGAAWHPKIKNFVFLNRLDLIDEDNSLQNDPFQGEHGGLEQHTQKIINNLHYNRKINDKTQLSIHHGIKHVRDNNDPATQQTTVDTASIEIRRDIGKKVDIGIQGGYLHDWSADTLEALAGVSIGITPVKNSWISLGYNFEGFYDKDFDKSNYKRQGPYVNFRYKFNQDSFDGDLPVRNRKKKNPNNKVTLAKNETEGMNQ